MNAYGGEGPIARWGDPVVSEKTWNPPESEKIGPAQSMNLWIPPMAEITDEPGRDARCTVLTINAATPHAAESVESSARTAPRVASGRNAGSSSSPCPVLSVLTTGRSPSYISRKLRRISLPAFVMIDSGWNWMPSTGWVLCRTPMMMSLSVQAVTSSSSGRSSR